MWLEIGRVMMMMIQHRRCGKKKTDSDCSDSQSTQREKHVEKLKMSEQEEVQNSSAFRETYRPVCRVRVAHAQKRLQRSGFTPRFWDPLWVSLGVDISFLGALCPSQSKRSSFREKVLR